MKPKPTLHASLLSLSILSGLGAQEQAPPRKITVLDIPSYPVLRTDATISIDGSLADWPKELPALLMDDPRQLSGTAHESWRGQSDLAARGALVWDDERLYLSMFVRDDWPRALPKETPIAAPIFPPCDTLEVFFDPKRDTRAAGEDPGRSEDREYVFGLMANKQPFSIAWRRLRGIRYSDSTMRGVMLYNARQRAWTIEASFEWKELLGTEDPPKQGLPLDANFVFTDYDAATDGLPQTRIGWTFGSHPTRINPAMRGTLILMGKSYDSKRPPERPKLPRSSGIGQPERATFETWIDRLRALPVKPGRAGLEGERGQLLEALDRELARYPLADAQQLLLLMQRRMQRELAGYLYRGAPHALTYAMLEMLETLPEKYESERPTIYALPGRGFVVRGKQGMVQFGAGFPVAERLVRDLNALCLQRAYDPMDRHDPLALRVFARKGAVFAHTSFHLHGYGPFDPHVVAPGSAGKIAGGLDARVLGSKGEDGTVSPSAGYSMRWPGGFSVVDAALSALPEQLGNELDKTAAGKKKIDVLILDPRHPEWRKWLEECQVQDVLLYGFFDLPRFRDGSIARNHRLADARDFLRELEKAGARAWLLAPGQSWQPPQ
jgi:hypothetical protein